MDPDPDAGLLTDGANPRLGESLFGHGDGDAQFGSQLGPQHPLDDGTSHPGDDDDDDDDEFARDGHRRSAANYTAALANAHHAAETVNPDVFYRSYEASQPSDGEPIHPLMASSVIGPSLCFGDAATAAASHLALSSNGSLPLSTDCAASDPNDGTHSTSGTLKRPSVKDLKKRFDQNGTLSSIPQPSARLGSTPPRAVSDAAAAAAVVVVKARSRATPYAALPAGHAHKSLAQETAQEGHDAARTRGQRSTVAPQEDPVPSSSRSFASRIGKPGMSVNGKDVTSSSMTHPSCKVASPSRSLHHGQKRSSSPPTAPATRGLLFGEILPQKYDVSSPGFGIGHGRSQKISESSRRHHHRRHSGPDTKSPSPSSWYRHVNQRVNPSHVGSASRPKGHTRSRSEVTVSPSFLQIARRPHTRFIPPTSLVFSSSISKIPIPDRKLRSPTNSSGPPSPPSYSPPGLKRARANARAFRPAVAPARAKTPTGRKGPPEALVTPGNKPRLEAYITTPPPKLSPTLRSSRPRRPVSLVVTASSRVRGSDSGGSSNGSDAMPLKSDDKSATRHRKVSVGPIDFERRREHIRLAYSRSIRESQAFETRKEVIGSREKAVEPAAMADVIISDLESLASAIAAAPTQTEQGISSALDKVGASSDSETRQPEHLPTEPFANPVVDNPGHGVEPRLALPAVLLPSPPQLGQLATDGDSPTLGIPSSIALLGHPTSAEAQTRSATSQTSEATDLDDEPRTSPPVQPYQSSLGMFVSAKPPAPQTSATDSPQPRYEDHSGEHPDPLGANPKVGHEASQAAGRDETDHPTILDSRAGFEGPSLALRPIESYAATLASPQPTETKREGGGEAGPVSSPRLDVQSRSDRCSDSDNAPRGDDAAVDACAEKTEEHDRFVLSRPDFRCGDPLSSYRSSTCASSDVGAPDDAHGRRLDAANTSSLVVPPSRTDNDRLSRESAWTDFSIDSADSDATKSSARQSRHESRAYGRGTVLESTTTTRERVSSRTGMQYGSDGQCADDSARWSVHSHQLQLPEVDAGESFSIPYLTQDVGASLSYLQTPDHRPPPVPHSAPASTLDSRTSSIFYDQSQRGSTLANSEQESDECAPKVPTPHSVDATQTDSDARSSAQGGDEPTSQERHRLIQRRNVIKELIDTEAVFVRDMNIVEEIYKGTAEACPELDGKTVKLVFRNSDEIIEFHTAFLRQLKAAVASVYVPRGGRAAPRSAESTMPEQALANTGEPSDARDRVTSLGPVFQENMERMKLVHEGFLRNSDQAAKQLIQIQQDSTVKMWLSECNEVAKDLTAAWDLDSLLIKPMQRITKYPNLIVTLLQHTPQDHPDREALMAAKESLENSIIEINKTKKNFELVGQIVGRKRKESDVKAGFARAFGKRVDKLQTSTSRAPEDADYVRFEEKFGDDYLRLQVVLRDVEFYTRQVSAYVHEFLQYLSSIELVMRLQPGSYPELESKWVQFNISMRDLEKVALEDHLAQVRKHVIEPFEHVIKAYGNPSLAMKKRQKRRLDFERSEQLKRSGKSVDPKLRELVEQYEALNDTLKKELPMLGSLTERVGNICLGNFVNIQANWFAIWKEKMKAVTGESDELPDLEEVMLTFQRDYPYAHEQLDSIGILNSATRGRASQSATSVDGSTIRTSRSGPSDVETRGRVLSVNGDAASSATHADFHARRSGSIPVSPSASSSGFRSGAAPSPHMYHYRDYYAGVASQQWSSASSRSPEISGSSRSLVGTGATSTRPSTRRSSDSANLHRRDSNTTYSSNQHESRYSNLFHSALPLPDGTKSQRSSRASSRERSRLSDGYNVLWFAASLFEFNIATTKQEAGYTYLTYQAGEVFDVIAEKGELWLAKNQDDSEGQIGWIWSKHFARLAEP
ncbi:hypothetical protein RJ55_00311 [Drechmeria coniospora]|nr:hypothetical protein RJ55_00311 [Drechmeria coniospora]